MADRATLTLADQIDEIAERRAWFRPDDDEPFHNIIKSYMNGTTSLKDAIGEIVNPINAAYTTGDSGNAIREAEISAAALRQEYSPEEAEARYGPPMPEAMLPPVVEGAPSTGGMLWELWFSVLHVAKKTPWNDSDAQGRLVTLVKALKEQPDPEPPVNKALQHNWVWGSSGVLWSVLAMFGPAAREAWNDLPRLADKYASFEAAEMAEIHAWTNVNAFAARLTKANVKNCWFFAGCALHVGLEASRGHHEKPHPNDPPRRVVKLTAADLEKRKERLARREGQQLQNPKAREGQQLQYQKAPADVRLDAHVPAAAACVIVLGRELYGRDRDLTQEPDAGSNPGGPGVLLKRRGGKPESSKTGWDFWKERFEVLRSHEGLEQSTRDIAAEACTKMEECERAADM